MHAEAHVPFDATLILVVDDDATFRNRLIRAINDRGYSASGASNATEAISSLAKGNYTHAVLDLKMPGESGLELLRTMKKQTPSMEVILLTGYGSIATAMEAVKIGAKDYLAKPADSDEILLALGLLKVESARITKTKVKVPSLPRVEWEHIHRVLADCEGNISQAAKLLGMHRRSLQRKLLKAPGAKD